MSKPRLDINVPATFYFEHPHPKTLDGVRLRFGDKSPAPVFAGIDNLHLRERILLECFQPPNQFKDGFVTIGASLDEIRERGGWRS